MRISFQCYHCNVAHPGVAATTNLDTYDVKTISRFIEHYSEALGTDNAGTVAPTYYFPNASYIITSACPQSTPVLKLTAY